MTRDAHKLDRLRIMRMLAEVSLRVARHTGESERMKIYERRTARLARIIAAQENRIFESAVKAA